MLQIYFFYTYTRDNTYGRVPLPHPPPLGVQYIILNDRWIPPPPPLVLKSYIFGGFLELELMLI